MKLLVAHWINERWKLFQGKESGNPYISTDYRMNQTRFCNVHRENDKVTRIIRQTWMKPEDNQDDLPLVGLLARRLNKVIAFENLDRPKNFTANSLYPKMNAVVNRVGSSLVNTLAYKVGLMGSYEGAPDGQRTHTWAICNLMHRATKVWIPKRFDTLEETHKYLTLLPHVGSFMSGQIVADLKHTKYLANAPDWWTWACLGPGSERGLNRYFTGNPESGLINPKNFLEHLHRMSEEVTPLLDPIIPSISAQDWQNVMCEFDKYLRFYDGPNTGKVYRSR